MEKSIYGRRGKRKPKSSHLHTTYFPWNYMQLIASFSFLYFFLPQWYSQVNFSLAQWY